MASIINASTSGAGGLIQTADSSGVLVLQSAGATIASVSGTGVAVTGNVSSTGMVADSLGTLRPLVSGTTVASTSGTSIEFTGIPNWVKRITVMVNGVSGASTNDILVRLGISTGLETTGYNGSSSKVLASTVVSTALNSGFNLFPSPVALSSLQGILFLTNLSGNLWVCSGSIGDFNSTATCTIAGSKTLGGVLDRIGLVIPSSTFDAGSINIMYE